MVNHLYRLLAFLGIFAGGASGSEEGGEVLSGDQNVPLTSRTVTDAWRAVMVIDEGNPFALVGNRAALRDFRFHVKAATGRVTPFVARRLGDNFFQVRAIGKTRIAGIDYTRRDVGTVVAFPFSEDSASTVVADGWVAGFLSADSDGANAGRPPIPYDVDGNEVWISGGPAPEDSGSLRLLAGPLRGDQLVLDEIRTYAFQISAVADAAEPTPPCEIRFARNPVVAGAEVGASVATLLASDPNAGESVTFSLAAGEGSEDNGLFALEGANVIVTEALPDEARDFRMRIRAEDAGGLAVEQALVLRALPNVPPERVVLDSTIVPLGARTGRRIAFLTAEDPNEAAGDLGDWHGFELADTENFPNNFLFSIEGDRLIWGGGLPSPGREYPIRIRATDRGGLSVEDTVVITGEALGNALIGNEIAGRKTSRSDITPAFYTSRAAMPAAGIVDAVEIYFQGQTISQTFHILQLRSDGLGGLRVVYDSGEIAPRGLQDEAVRLPFPNGPTEVQPRDFFAHYGRGIPLNIGIESTDTGDNFFPVYIPTERPVVGSVVSLPGNTLRLGTGPFRDYAWSVHFRPTDPLPPTAIVAEPAVVTTHAPAGTLVARLEAIDPNPDAAHTFRIVEGSGFAVDGASLVLAEDAPSADAELSVHVEATDSDGLTFAQMLTVRVIAPQAPTAIRPASPAVFSRLEPGDTLVRLLVDDVNIAAGDEHTFELGAGYGDDDNARVSVSGDDLVLRGEIQQAFLRVRVRATDSSGLSFERAIELPVARLLGGELASRDLPGDASAETSAVFYTPFEPVPEPGTALGVSYSKQGGAGEFSIVQFRTSVGSDNVYNVIHSSGNIAVAGGGDPGTAHLHFPSGSSRVEAGDLFGHYGNGIPHSERGAAEDGFVPIYWAPLRPTRPNIITLGSQAFRLAPANARNYAWAVQWLPDSVRNQVADIDGDGLPDAWEREMFGALDEIAAGDPDGDGLANVLEFLTLTDPGAANLPPAIDMDFSGDSTLVTVLARDVAGISQRLLVEYSTDLREWSALSNVGFFDGKIGGALVSAPHAGFLRLRALP